MTRIVHSIIVLLLFLGASPASTNRCSCARAMTCCSAESCSMKHRAESDGNRCGMRGCDGTHEDEQVARIVADLQDSTVFNALSRLINAVSEGELSHPSLILPVVKPPPETSLS